MRSGHSGGYHCAALGATSPAPGSATAFDVLDPGPFVVDMAGCYALVHGCSRGNRDDATKPGPAGPFTRPWSPGGDHGRASDERRPRVRRVVWVVFRYVRARARQARRRTETGMGPATGPGPAESGVRGWAGRAPGAVAGRRALWGG
ncbi:hypothetical protein GCM10023324_24570 [Streptomyces youssoufiensis]